MILSKVRISVTRVVVWKLVVWNIAVIVASWNSVSRIHMFTRRVISWDRMATRIFIRWCLVVAGFLHTLLGSMISRIVILLFFYNFGFAVGWFFFNVSCLNSKQDRC